MASTPFLFVLVDAIPHDVARRAWMDGAFPGFPPPSQLVSTFPSLTYVAIPAIVRGISQYKPPGYEAVWFDPERGTLVRDLDHIEPHGVDTWPRLNLFAEGALYALPRGFTYSQTRWIKQAAPRHLDRPWVGWISATDALGHFKGRAAMHRAVSAIGGQVAQVREEYARIHGSLPRVVLASDHGMEFGIRSHLTQEDLQRFLALSGFAGPWGALDGVVVAALGVVGCGVLHTHPERAEAVAEVVSQAAGVDLAMARTRTGAAVFAVRGGGVARADLHWDGDRYRYDPVSGDPLACADLAGTWTPDRESFERTAGRRYPDAWRRIRDGLDGGICQVPATVLFSMEAGWTFVPLSVHTGASLVGGILATHGALHAAQTCGFVMDTAGRLPPFLRPWEVSSMLAGGIASRDMVGAALPWRREEERTAP